MVDETRGTQIYVSKFKINGKEHELRYNHMDEVEDINEHDLNPIVYLRLSRPMRPEAQIPLINLSNFYEQTNVVGLSFNVTPDYSFKPS